MHQALYRKWRPRTFDEVCGQEHITSILSYEVANNKHSHAYLFCGSRGTGKTSCAKILAKAVNCLDPIGGNPCGKCSACLSIESGAATDVLEMDAASNNGVDNIRDIRDEVVYAPSNLKYRVYIIDEVHMLSTSAFNALLKTLEEPPEHVVFILATTELHKLPATIISRCQRFDFRRISTDVLKNHLLKVAKSEGIELEESAAVLLAKQAQGGMRDAISLLDLCAGSRERIDEALVNRTVGKSGREEMLTVVQAIAKKDYEAIFASVSEVVKSSRDIEVFWQDLMAVYRDMLVVKSSKDPSLYLDLTDSETKALSDITSKFTQEQLAYHSALLTEALLTMNKANAVRRITAELTLIKMCDERLSTDTSAILSRLGTLENALLSGSFVRAAEAEVKPAEPTSEENREKSKRRKQPIYEDDDDMFKGDAPSSVSAAKAEKKETKAVNVRTLKPYRSRAEIIEEMDRTDIMQSAFFKCAKWYTDSEGRIVLKFATKFELDNVTLFGGEEFFKRVVSNSLGRPIGKNDFVFEYSDEKKQDSVIDQILENAEE